MVDGATDPLTAAPSATDVALLQKVRLARDEGFDRFVVEFQGALPGYDVRYVDAPIHGEPSGSVVAVAGTRFLRIRVGPASQLDRASSPPQDTYPGPDRVTSNTAVVTEAVLTGDTADAMTWVLGVDAERRFRVSTLADPPRLVVDVASS
jgi:hypothetical protein